MPLWVSDESFVDGDARRFRDAVRHGRGSVATMPNSDLSDPGKKDIAPRLVSSAENSSLDWRAQFGYVEDIDDGRGYTAGIIGFCSGTGDMLELVEAYRAAKPG